MLAPGTLDHTHDVELANAAPWQDQVLHVVNHDFLGIRAAAASLPGHTLALDRLGSVQQGVEDLRAAVMSVDPERVVFHGMSPLLAEAARALRRSQPRLRLFGVLHGNLAQWAYHEERAEAARFLELDRSGVYERSHILKPGADVLLRSPSPRILVNCAPGIRREPTVSDGIVFVPGSDNIRKNVHLNAIAAELSARVDTIWHYADLSDSPVPLTKSRALTYSGTAGHAHVVAAASLVVHATVIDCHPMVDLEANAAGRLSVHGDYRLGVLDDHAAEQLCRVDDPHDLGAVLERINAVLSLSSVERTALALDFAAAMTAESIARYEEFLEL